MNSLDQYSREEKFVVRVLVCDVFGDRNKLRAQLAGFAALRVNRESIKNPWVFYLSALKSFWTAHPDAPARIDAKDSKRARETIDGLLRWARSRPPAAGTGTIRGMRAQSSAAGPPGTR